MEKFKTVYSIIVDIWKAISKYKEKDVSQDEECEQILAELQEVCDSFRDIGETESILAKEISHLFLEYLCRKE